MQTSMSLKYESSSDVSVHPLNPNLNPNLNTQHTLNPNLNTK